MGNWVGLCAEFAQFDVGRHVSTFIGIATTFKGTAQKYKAIIVISKQTHVIEYNESYMEFF